MRTLKSLPWGLCYDNWQKNVEIESQVVGKVPHQGVQRSGLVPAAFNTTTTTITMQP